MELFKAGDESQWKVIQRWIDASDVYMLIVGGRYGSTDPKTGKSYTELEYEYAVLEKKKPFFAIIISDAFLRQKEKEPEYDVEKEYYHQWKTFRDTFTKGYLIRFFDDIKDIRIAISDSLAEISQRSDLIGWIPGNEGVNSSTIVKEMAKLIKENTELKQQLAEYSSKEMTFLDLTFKEFYEKLLNYPYPFDALPKSEIEILEKIASVFGDNNIGSVHVLWRYQIYFIAQMMLPRFLLPILKVFVHFGISESRTLTNDIGKPFLFKMQKMPNAENANQFISKPPSKQPINISYL